MEGVMYASLSPTSATVLVFPLSTVQCGAYPTLFALALIVIQLFCLSFCYSERSTTVGRWFHMLQGSGMVALTSASLGTTFSSFLWLPEHFRQNSGNISSVTVILVVTAIVTLGLEKSHLLRFLQFLSVTLLLFILLLSGLPVQQNLTNLDYKTLNETVDSSSIIVAGVVGSISGNFGFPFSLSRVDRIFQFIVTIAIIISTVIILQSSDVSMPTENLAIWFLNAVLNKWLRLLILTLIISNLSLALPEIVIENCFAISALRNRMLPSVAGKTLIQTGTRVWSFVMAGFISSIMAVTFSILELVQIVTLGFQFQVFADILHTLWRNYQPSFAQNCLDPTEAKYSMLPVTLDNENQDELSEDSGHSSDTDIDEVVAEFKEQVKVAAITDNKFTEEPTAKSGKRVTICLINTLAFMTFSVIGLKLNNPALFMIGISITLLLLVYISRQPSVNHIRTPIIWPALTLQIAIIILCNLHATIYIFTLVWSAIGSVLWLKFNKKYSNKIFTISRDFLGRMS